MKQNIKKLFRNRLQKHALNQIKTIDDVFRLYEMQRSLVSFLQVGANDGISNDPTAEFKSHSKWSGIFLEPQSGPFQLLKQNFSDARYQCVNSAMDRQSGTRPLYKIAFSDSRMANGLSTFNEETMKRFFDTGYAQTVAQEVGLSLELHKPGDWKNYVTEETVSTISFENLLVLNGSKDFNVMLIDTEGFDAEIIDMTNIGPRLDIVLFENAHLSEYDYGRSVEKLKKSGFTVKNIKADTIAFRNIYLPVFSIRI
jgi:FkbM family methyltransferase